VNRFQPDIATTVLVWAASSPQKKNKLSPCKSEAKTSWEIREQISLKVCSHRVAKIHRGNFSFRNYRHTTSPLKAKRKGTTAHLTLLPNWTHFSEKNRHDAFAALLTLQSDGGQLASFEQFFWETVSNFRYFGDFIGA
jgi:hypothetical protein